MAACGTFPARTNFTSARSPSVSVNELAACTAVPGWSQRGERKRAGGGEGG